jgi:hypothetical protein
MEVSIANQKKETSKIGKLLETALDGLLKSIVKTLTSAEITTKQKFTETLSGKDEVIKEKYQSLRDQLIIFLTIDLDKVRDLKTDYVEVTWNPVLPWFEAMLDLAKRLFDNIPNDLPEEVLSGAAEQLRESKNRFDSIFDYELTGDKNDAIKQIQDFTDQLRQQYNSFFRVIVPILSYSMTSDKIVEQADRLGKLMERAEHEINERLETFSELQLKIEKMIKPAALAAQATHFEDEALKNRTNAVGWLILIGFIFFFGVIFAVEYLNPLTWSDEIKDMALKLNLDLKSNFQSFVISLGIVRVVIFSIFFFLVAWAARNFRAERHNSVVNRHRALAIRTYEAFIDEAITPEVRAAVLDRVTQTIFSPMPSGHLGGEKDAQLSVPVIGQVQKILGGKDGA